MSQVVHFQILPKDVANDALIRQLIREKLHVDHNSFHYEWKKRSIDARNKLIKINCQFDVYLNNEKPELIAGFSPQLVHHKKSVAIVGAGPAGLFAALRCIELGIKPILFERGKDVRARRRDLAILNKDGVVNPESNYCFGEGGAGTYSDGKLYTRSKKRGDVEKVMRCFVHFGANPDILVDAHPHIGTNKLPQLIVAMREAILASGGELYFESKLTDITIENQAITGIEINQNQWFSCDDLILSTGHSARDIFYLLHAKKIKIESKSFALGVRIEHTQELIDRIQYHGNVHGDNLPPASYSLVTQVDGKGVYSFCMCPGGIIAPCATDKEEVVTNGWSPSKRNNSYSNSGIVVSIEPHDLAGHHNNPFVCLDFQKQIEHECWIKSGKTQRVPAQRMLDFIQLKQSVDFPRSSYQPGIVSVDLNTIFPDFISKRLRMAMLDFGKKMNGFLTNEAVLHAPESRTSSPISIPRDNQTMEHIEIKGLYPCGEGAGYAGGIISAAIDGMKCAEALFEKFQNHQ